MDISRQLKELAGLYTMEEITEVINIFWDPAYMVTKYQELGSFTTVDEVLAYLDSQRVYLSTGRLKPEEIGTSGKILRILLTPFKEIPLRLEGEGVVGKEAFIWRLQKGK